MWTSPSDLFSQICSKVSNKMYFEQLMLKQQQFFDIQPYKIDKLYSEPAKKLYKQIFYKYQVTKQLIPNHNLWHENERKIFIWFMVCYFHQIGAQDPLEVNSCLSQVTLDWENLSEIFFFKSPSFLKFQFLNIIKLKKRIIWTTEEDAILAKATQEEGIGKWNEISKALFFNSNGHIFKSPKHCRQRWLNHLDTNKNKGKWIDEEDYKILMYVKDYGKKWSKIVQVLNHTRTEHMIKNRFNSLLTKNRKNKKQKQLETVNKVIKTLERTLNGCPTSNEDHPACQNLARTSLAQLQYDEQIRQDHLSEKNITQRKIMKEGKQEAQVKKSIEAKPVFEISSFETSTLFSTFSNGLQTHAMKEEQVKLSINCHSNFLLIKEPSKFVQFMDKRDLIEHLNQEARQLTWLKNKQKGSHKIKPVHILQLNI